MEASGGMFPSMGRRKKVFQGQLVTGEQGEPYGN